ncbi:TonB family protein [Porphyrobacter algicida]|uniref:TonB family protein n=1 Tax=Qipengyuania algicida TaxID=1836209 RepID=A0A845ALJ0_9SPHN|nr:energy transducer TonB [Qipengyuania algicida]MXP30033.1 TonB family protein [Qipengyuania algicida]
MSSVSLHSPAPVSQTSSPPDLLAAYSARLRALILARQPTTSASSGQVTIGFEVTLTGDLVNSAVTASSGNVRLDRAALNMVRRAAPFPRPDQAIPSDKLHFRIDVRFH